MKLTRSESLKKYWAGVSPEKRKQHMSMMAAARAAKMTKKDRSAHAKMMVNARKTHPVKVK